MISIDKTEISNLPSARSAVGEEWPQAHTIDDDDEMEVLAALRQDNWSNGEKVAEFEHRFAAFCGSRHALLVVNGTAAIKLAMASLKIGPGDEVIVPDMTWASVPIAVMECGAMPVPADIEPDTYGISARTIEPLITKRTRAVIPTHLYCSQVDMLPIIELCRASQIYIIEDAAHVVGARRMGKALGTLGIAGAFSFNQKKLLSCGEGGCLVTDEEDIYRRAQRLREINPDRSSIGANLPGTYMVSELQAGLLISQLKKLPAKLSRIEENGEYLRSLIDAIEGARVLSRLDRTDLQTFYGFCFRLAGIDDIMKFRLNIQNRLGFQCRGVYFPISEAKVMQLPAMDRYRKRAFALHRPNENCRRAQREAVRLHYRALLAGKSSIATIADVVREAMMSSSKASR